VARAGISRSISCLLQLSEEFIKGQKGVPPALLARAALDAAIADPRPEAVRLMAVLNAQVVLLDPFIRRIIEKG
jgi:hypothetical protein